MGLQDSNSMIKMREMNKYFLFWISNNQSMANLGEFIAYFISLSDKGD